MFTPTKKCLSLMLFQGGGEARREQKQDPWPKLAKEVFHTTARHTQYRNWGSYPEGPDHCSGRAGYWSAGAEQLYSLALLFSLIGIIIGGCKSSFVLYLSYWTALISTNRSDNLSIILLIPLAAGRGRRVGANEGLHGLKPGQFFVAPKVGHKGLR